MIAIGIESIISVLGIMITYSLCYIPLLLIAMALHFIIMGNKERSFMVPIVFAVFEPVAVALPHIIIYFLNKFLPEGIQKILMPRGFWQSLITGEIIGFILLVIAITLYVTFFRKFKKEGVFAD